MDDPVAPAREIPLRPTGKRFDARKRNLFLSLILEVNEEN
jgi:hypothetical protein